MVEYVKYHNVGVNTIMPVCLVGNCRRRVETIVRVHTWLYSIVLDTHRKNDYLWLTSAIPGKSTLCKCLNHRVHRVAMSTCWRTFQHDGKISPAWWGWGYTPTPFHLYVPSRTKVWCTLQLRGPIHSPYFYSTPVYTLWLELFRTIHFHIFNKRIQSFQGSCTLYNSSLIYFWHLLNGKKQNHFFLVAVNPKLSPLIILTIHWKISSNSFILFRKCSSMTCHIW